jgi:MarR family transcriptional regulator, lower aerobic nicotinate degradation pathway regulator
VKISRKLGQAEFDCYKLVRYKPILGQEGFRVASREALDMGLLADLVGYRIRLAQIAAYKDFESVTKEFGQAPRYFGLLALIEANPGLPQGKLADAIHLVRSSLVPIIDKLESDGIVERRAAGGDRRLKAVWLTTNGQKILARLKPHVLAHEERLTAGMSKRDKVSLLRLLRHMDDNLRNKKKMAEVA